MKASAIALVGSLLLAPAASAQEACILPDLPFTLDQYSEAFSEGTCKAGDPMVVDLLRNQFPPSYFIARFCSFDHFIQLEDNKTMTRLMCVLSPRGERGVSDFLAKGSN